MKPLRKYFLIILTIILAAGFTLIYIGLEYLYYGDAGCGCSSACTGFFMSTTSKAIGWTLLVFSGSLFIAGVWRVKQLSRLWTIPALIIFIFACYGNGYMLFNKGPCGQSLNRTTFFIFQEKLGDFAKPDGETLYTDSLKTTTYHGKLLGYYLNGNELTVYRIAAKPLKISTGFLFWQPDKNELIKHLSYGLNTYRVPSKSFPERKIELIGGQDMPLEAFTEEMKTTNNRGFSNIVNQQMINSDDGTTRLILHVE
jgi:hypothetical protein